MKWLNIIIRYAVGLLFIISGLIKVNDPVGTAIKLDEYFEVFAADISPIFISLIPAALFLSVFLSVLEVALGVALLVRFKPKLTTALLLIIIVFFTFLTFYSAYFNKVTDCGCFGDALKLSPWQSFSKDIILLVLIVFLFIHERRPAEQYRKSPATSKPGYIVAAITVLCLFAAWFAINHLPFKDFRAYAVGTNIPVAMQPSGKFEYAYIMEKDGKQYELDAYPAESEGYKFVEMKTLNPEVGPKITDFNLWNDEGDYTEEVLSGTKLLVLIQKTEGIDAKAIDNIKELLPNLNAEIEPVIIASESGETLQQFLSYSNLNLPFAYADATLVKTIIRSNPGLMLLVNGEVRGKWHYNDVPEIEELRNLL